MFAHLTLATRDVRATSRFFQQTLAWRPIRTPANTPPDADWLEIAPGQQLHLLLVEDFTPSAFEQEFGRHCAIFHSGRDFEALKERLRANGAELIDAIRPTPHALRPLLLLRSQRLRVGSHRSRGVSGRVVRSARFR